MRDTCRHPGLAFNLIPTLPPIEHLPAVMTSQQAHESQFRYAVDEDGALPLSQPPHDDGAADVPAQEAIADAPMPLSPPPSDAEAAEDARPKVALAVLVTRSGSIFATAPARAARTPLTAALAIDTSRMLFPPGTCCTTCWCVARKPRLESKMRWLMRDRKQWLRSLGHVPRMALVGRNETRAPLKTPGALGTLAAFSRRV